MDQTFRNLVKAFRQMDSESQQNVIDRVSNRGKGQLAEYLRKIRDMQKRGNEIDDLAESIISKLEENEQ